VRDVNREEFAEDVKAGMSISGLKKKYGLQFDQAKKLKLECEGVDLGKDGDEPAPEAEAEPDTYDLTTAVPANRLMDLIRALDFEELCEAIESIHVSNQAAILQSVMQKKMDRLLEPKDISVSNLELKLVQSAAS